MSRRFILLYDCPIKKCDKLWLYRELKKNGNVIVVDTGLKITYFRLSRIGSKLKIGKILVRFFILLQTIKAIFVSNKEDIIVTWNNLQGAYMNFVCNIFKIKRKIVSFCWIDLSVKNYYKKALKCLKNQDFMPIINAEHLKETYMEEFNLEQWNGFYLPDVFDDNEEFLETKYNKGKKYCFAGGVNNRDWKLLIKVAEELPNIKFMIVTGKDDIKEIKLPDNVEHFEELPSKEYFSFMKNSFLTLCPLKEDRVSGLINIIKSIQYGIPCITTDLGVASIYYPPKLKNSFLLYEKSNKESLKKCIENAWNISEKDYTEIANELQKYLREEFNPQKNIEKLLKEISNRNW